MAGDYPAGNELLALREDALRRAGIPESDPRWGMGWVLRSWISSNQGRIAEAWSWSEKAEVGDPAVAQNRGALLEMWKQFKPQPKTK